jgi:hypothetical protein
VGADTKGHDIVAQWIDACAKDDIDAEDVIRFDHSGEDLRDL